MLPEAIPSLKKSLRTWKPFGKFSFCAFRQKFEKYALILGMKNLKRNLTAMKMMMVKTVEMTKNTCPPKRSFQSCLIAKRGKPLELHPICLRRRSESKNKNNFITYVVAFSFYSTLGMFHSYFDMKWCFNTDAFSTVPLNRTGFSSVAAGKCKRTSAPSMLFKRLLIYCQQCKQYF